MERFLFCVRVVQRPKRAIVNKNAEELDVTDVNLKESVKGLIGGEEKMNDDRGWNEENTITVNQILDLYSKLGIPHFQRGIVWSEEHIAFLLESLYYDTPCGSIVLWETQKKELGVALDKEFEYLIVDGQQRIRAINSVFNECLNSNNPTNSDNKCWCVNLSKLKEFKDLLKENEKHKKMKLFVNIKDPAIHYNEMIKSQNEGNRSLPFLYNVVPIRYFLDNPLHKVFFKGKDKDQSADGIFLDVKENAKDFKTILDSLRPNFEKILSRELFVKTLKDENGDTNGHMISIYNGINCGGIRAQKEEIAYAKVSAHYKKTHEKIKTLFEEIHGESKSDEREFMHRMKERNFGFKFFMKVLTMVINNELKGSPGTKGLNYDNILSSNKLGGVKEEVWEKIWAKTKNVVIQIRKILNDLCCDDLRFLPETTSLAPVIQILIQNEGEISSEDNKALCGLTLRLLLSELYEIQIYSIVSKIEKAKEKNMLAICEQVIKRVDNCNITKYIYDKLGVKNEKSEGDYESNLKEFLKTRLAGKKSIVDRYTLLLYWLLRERKARDFSYINNNTDSDNDNSASTAKKLLNKLKEKLGSDEKLSLEEENGVYFRERFNPEKEHVIIFSKIKSMFGDSNRGAHLLNNIGNITYISNELNGGEYGKWDKFLNLKGEDEKNLEAHFLNSEELLRIYNEIIEKLECYEEKKKDSNDKYVSEKEINVLFESFCEKRRTLIIEGFIQWLNELKCS